MPQNNRKYFRKGKKEKFVQPVVTGRVEDAVLDTLSYRSIFGYPMNLYQLSTFLLTKKRILHAVLNAALEKLQLENKVVEKNGKFSLNGASLVPWKKRGRNSRKLFKKANRAARILAKVPWIVFIGVTGSVAAYNATKNDDIDLFIVTKTHRLWLTRGFVFVILKILGELRTDAKPNRKLCPNIFVDDNSLEWNKRSRNVYVAHEVVMLHPLFDREQVYFRFLKENNWAFKFFGNLQEPQYELKMPKQKNTRLVNIFEKLAYKSQLVYMKDKKTTEITTQGVIHFNKSDNTKRILSEFERVRGKSV